MYKNRRHPTKVECRLFCPILSDRCRFRNFLKLLSYRHTPDLLCVLEASPFGAKLASGGPFFPIAGKVGKRARRNLRFLHFRARYTLIDIRNFIPHVRARHSSSIRHRIVSASAPLPLIPTTNSAVGSTVDNASGSDAEEKSIRHAQR